MEHTWRGEKDHRLVRLKQCLVVRPHVLEFEQVLLDEGLFDLFVRPVDEELVVEVGFFG